MKPEAALQKQIECYRNMTGEQRLLIALNLHELSCNVAQLISLAGTRLLASEAAEAAKVVKV